jgi:DNA polymerase alpha subunit p180 N terminal
MASQKRSRAQVLKELKLAREGGGRAKQYKVCLATVLSESGLLTPRQANTDTALYDVVDEKEYKDIVRSRLDQDDFVVDDGVGGYTDHGMDVFDGEENHSGEDVKRKHHFHNFVADWILICLRKRKRRRNRPSRGASHRQSPLR